MKIQARHKLIPAIAMLLIAVVCLSSASYAWFTMSRTVTATGINLTVIAPTNLLISNKADADFAETTTVVESFGDYRLIPASSINGTTFVAPEQIKEINAGAPDATTKFNVVTQAITADSTTGAKDGNDGYYADFKLWLKTTGEDDVDVTVSKMLTVIGGDAQGSLRFAILDGTGAAIAGTSPIYGISKDVSNVGYFKDLTGAVDSAAVTPTQTPEAYKGVVTTVNSDNKLFTCVGGAAGTANAATAITVRVWIEGQDKDCTTALAANKAVELTVGFRDVKYTTGQGAINP